MKLTALILIALSWLTVGSARMETKSSPPRKVTMSEPVVVSMADPSETRWGRHQFVSLSPYPGNRILLRFHSADDAVNAYGSSQPTLISADGGRTWAEFKDEGLPTSGLCCELFNGEFLCLPGTKPLDVAAAKLSLPQPVGEFSAYRKISLYRADQAAPEIQAYLSSQSGLRWTPQTKKWTAEQVSFDMRNRLIWVSSGKEAGLVSGTSFEHAPLHVGHELLVADYRATYLTADGSAPKGCAVSCMVSNDNGQTWQRRGTIAQPDAIPGELHNMMEPAMTRNGQGQLVCVIRRADQKQKSMLITFSKDRGRTWETPRPLDELGQFGVMPALLRLEDGPLVLSYGRPGVHLAFSWDGSGRKWDAPLTLIAGDPEKLLSKTDGYTVMLPLSKTEFLLAYTDFEHPNAQGQKCKAILVRRIEVKP